MCPRLFLLSCSVAHVNREFAKLGGPTASASLTDELKNEPGAEKTLERTDLQAIYMESIQDAGTKSQIAICSRP
jgi:hypothetical protein